MATYLNAYEILSQVRLGLHEFSEDLAQGTDTDYAFDNEYLMQKINDAQRYVFSRVFKAKPEWFLTSATATFSGSAYTLPWDYGMIHELQDDHGNKVFRIAARQKTPTASSYSGSESYYYQKGNVLYLDKDGVNASYTMWYYTKPRDIDTGRVTATGSLTMTLDTSAKKIADYYNGMTVENTHSDWTDTIDDYTAARVATISESANIDDVYGIVSELPEPFHFLIPKKALIDVKSEHPLTKDRVNQFEVKMFEDYFNETLSVFGARSEDINLEDLFDDFMPFDTARTVVIDN